MCGTVHHEHLAKRIGALTSFLSSLTGTTQLAPWQSFIQSEKLEWWTRIGEGEPGYVLANSFTEKGNEFKVETGKLRALLLHKDVSLGNGTLISKAGGVRIVTRPPRNSFEERIHHRWPLSEISPGKHQEFTPAHLISVSDQLTIRQ